jgi:N-hydroxyarylamine O-acetyltransferase
MNARVLVLGRLPEVLDMVVGELRDAGLDVEGSTAAARAGGMFDARRFDLIAFGGGLRGPVEDELKRGFAEQNPAVRFLDVFAPQAAHQILSALNGNHADTVDLEAYCTRIGYDGPPSPTLATLRTLIARHTDAIPFEAIDVLLDKGVELAPAVVDAKLIAARRGGYCYEQNGLLRRVLVAIGFAVEPMVARVRWMLAPGAPPTARSHMVLRVTIDGEAWLADVGFGSCVPTSPLRLDTNAPQPTAHETFRIIPFGDGHLLQADILGRWMPVYQIDPGRQLQIDYDVANWFTATHPGSHFRHRLIVTRTTPEARHVLLANRLTIRPAKGDVEQRFLDVDQLEQVLAGTFTLPFDPAWRPILERAVATGPELREALRRP